MSKAEELERLLNYAREHDVYGLLKGCEVRVRFANSEQEVYIYQTLGVDKQFGRELAWQQILYNHEIARALFGNEPYRMCEGKGQHSDADELKWVWGGTNYQFHLQRAVIDKDPIGYMYKEVFHD